MTTASRITLGAVALVFPLLVSAHEHGTYRIGDKTYLIEIGMIDEPSVVDKAGGVELSVSLHEGEETEHHDDEAGEDHEEGTPVTGLESSVKVDVTAAGKTKTLALSPAWGTPGSYEAMFVPTASTTYAFRVHGTINNTDVDITYVCNPAGHPQTPEETTEKKLSDSVTQLSHEGAFGCPLARESVTFPDTLPGQAQMTGGSGAIAWVGAIAGVLALVLSVMGMRKRSA